MKLPQWLEDWGPVVLVLGIAIFLYARGEGAGEMAGRSPDFTLPRLGGGELTLSALDGKVRVLDFWATWCGPCKLMTPQLVDLHRKYADRGVVVVGIALDDEAAVRRYVAEKEVPYPIVIGDHRVASAFGGIRGIPTTFILDRQGRITHRHVGFRPVQIFEVDIAGLI